jgi:hypothetical protein
VKTTRPANPPTSVRTTGSTSANRGAAHGLGGSPKMR